MRDELAYRYSVEDITDADTEPRPVFTPHDLSLVLLDKLPKRDFERVPLGMRQLSGTGTHLVQLWLRDRPIDDARATGSFLEHKRTGAQDSVALWSDGKLPSRIAGTAVIFGASTSYVEAWEFADALCEYIDYLDKRRPPLGRVETARRKRHAEARRRVRQQQGYAF